MAPDGDTKDNASVPIGSEDPPEVRSGCMRMSAPITQRLLSTAERFSLQPAMQIDAKQCIVT